MEGGWSLNWAEVAVLDANAEALGIPTEDLMSSAGKSVADVAIDQLQASKADYAETIIFILAGPGNNGGDGFAAALYLSEVGLTPILLASHQKQKTELSQLMRDRCKESSIQISTLDRRGEWAPPLPTTSPTLIIDSLLGVGPGGLGSAPRGAVSEITSSISEWTKNKPVIIAADVPTGFGATGCLKADITVTFHAPKEGMLSQEGESHPDVGEIIVAPLPWPEETLNPGPGDLLRIPPLHALARKGERGKVLVIGGGPYHGAPVLSALSASRTGTDLIHLAMPSKAAERIKWPIGIIPEELSATSHLTPNDIDSITECLDRIRPGAVVVGPGLGATDETVAAVEEVLIELAARKIPTVVDADAIRALPPSKWPPGLVGVLTPHRGEAERWLQGVEPSAVLVEPKQNPESRVIVLTGPVDELYGLGGRFCTNTGGHPRMAVGGTGDLLAGAIGGFMAQGMSPWPATRIGTWLVREAGKIAGDEWGLTLKASDVPDYYRYVLK